MQHIATCRYLLNHTSSVRSWINSTSDGDSQVSTSKHSSYSTNRDPMVTMSRWRLGQDFEHTEIVQSG